MKTLFNLVMLSFVVGLVVAVAGIDPLNLWSDLAGTIREIWGLFWDTAHWAVRYIVLGAIIVVPIWLVIVLIQRASEANSSR
jgi:hypothetical protein